MHNNKCAHKDTTKYLWPSTKIAKQASRTRAEQHRIEKSEKFWDSWRKVGGASLREKLENVGENIFHHEVIPH